MTTSPGPGPTSWLDSLARHRELVRGLAINTVLTLAVIAAGYAWPHPPLALPAEAIAIGTEANVVTVAAAACTWLLVAYVAVMIVSAARKLLASLSA